MRFSSRFAIPFTLAIAVAGINTFNQSDACVSGYCLTFSKPATSAVMAAALPQQGPGRGKISPLRDPQLEVQSLRSLEAAQFYFKKRLSKDGDKNPARLKTIADRLQEIVDTYPDFTRINEVYFLLGEVSLRNHEETRAKTDEDSRKLAAELMIKAQESFEKVVKEYPDSKFAKDAQKRLDEINTAAKSGTKN
jgi:outer membrane protein assembly factor BamD (BamD/ComL family)